MLTKRQELDYDQVNTCGNRVISINTNPKENPNGTRAKKERETLAEKNLHYLLCTSCILSVPNDVPDQFILTVSDIGVSSSSSLRSKYKDEVQSEENAILIAEASLSY